MVHMACHDARVVRFRFGNPAIFKANVTEPQEWFRAVSSERSRAIQEIQLQICFRSRYATGFQVWPHGIRSVTRTRLIEAGSRRIEQVVGHQGHPKPAPCLSSIWCLSDMF